MWCKVQQCSGPNGERLKREQWGKAVEGDLTIGLGQHSFVAHLEKPLPAERFETVLYPLGDVRVQTFEEGIVVLGYRTRWRTRITRSGRLGSRFRF